jgi:hypothetical protein
LFAQGLPHTEKFLLYLRRFEENAENIVGNWLG